MAIKSFVQDPDAVLDYKIDYTRWLGDDVIISSTWTADAGITITDPAATYTTKAATVWVSGGTVGTRYNLTNSITTQSGREDDRTITIVIREQ